MSWFTKIFGRRSARSAIESSVPDGAAMPDFAAFPNPGRGHTIHVEFADAQGTWSEQVDLTETLATIVGRHVGPCERDGAVVRTPDGLVLAPQVVMVQPLDQRQGARIASTIEVTHPAHFTPGLFEWQHAVSDSTAKAIEEGFAQWAQCDLPALRNALRSDALDLTHLQYTSTDGAPRRIVLGPVYGLVPDDAADSDHEPGCPCCMFTHSFAVFRALLDRTETYGIRLFAMRGPDGEIGADCRVNGADFPRGAEALRAYARSWPGVGLQTRKQYVIMQPPPDADGVSPRPA
ncbi:MAG: DUF6348 family protein [Deltaproteobacteria bacterium]|nr:DUF6348 family protein [Deltaproteobacteria bacterium]